MNVPKLRFKEFNDEWKENKLHDIAKITMGQSPNSENYTYDSSDTLLIQGNADLYNGKVIPRLFTKQITKTCDKEDIIMTVRAPVGDIAISDYYACIGRGVCSIKSSKFIYHYLDYLKEKGYWKKISKGSTIDSITSDNIKSLVIKTPSRKEQEKIIRTIDLINKKIELQTKKIEALKLFKSSQICTILNKLEHKNVFLKNLGYFISGNPIGKDKITDKGIPVILYGDLYTKYEEEINDVNQYVKENKKYIKSEKGDLIFPTSTTVDAISLISPSVINISDVVYGGDLIVFKVNKAIVNSKFLSYQINHLKKKEFSKKAQGSTIIHIHADDLLNSTVEIPIMKYQNIISNFGSAINKKIELEKNKLDKLKLLKIGLLQNMFI